MNCFYVTTGSGASSHTLCDELSGDTWAGVLAGYFGVLDAVAELRRVVDPEVTGSLVGCAAAAASLPSCTGYDLSLFVSGVLASLRRPSEVVLLTSSFAPRFPPRPPFPFPPRSPRRLDLLLRGLVADVTTLSAAHVCCCPYTWGMSTSGNVPPGPSLR